MGGGTAKRYARALFETAAGTGQEETVLNELRFVEKILADHPALRRLLAAPTLNEAEKLAVLDAVFAGNLEELSLRFLQLLARKSRIQLLAEISAAFAKQVYRRHGILTVQAVTPQALPEKAADALRAKLERITGKTVVLEQQTDPSLLGGILLRMGGRQLDMSLKARLARAAAAMRAAK